MSTPQKPKQLMGFALHCVQSGLLSHDQAENLLRQSKEKQESFITELAQSQLIDDEILAKNTAEYFSLTLINCDEHSLQQCSSTLLRHPLLEKYQALPFFEDEGLIKIAVIDPTLELLDEIPFLTGKKIELYIAQAQKLRLAIDSLTKNDFKQVLENLDEGDLAAIKDLALDHENSSSLTAPVVRFIHKILSDAITQKASDIHFEPFENQYRIRFRRDGLLSTVSEPPLKLSPIITARLKILASLDISERRIPQDGRFRLSLSPQSSVDFRVNTCPTLDGEKIVLRCLKSKIDQLDLQNLGMNSREETLFLKALHQNQGLILVSGPTGSGKTSTLYTGLKLLNTLEKNISTVEDPVEIQLPGINQVHINLKTGLSFATALRAFLRQDPDIIMVGEIRDLETAEIAVQASHTGHLVLSTIHTNSAPQTLVRLAQMGIPAYNIASSIALIIAQRLVRRLCEHCKKFQHIPSASLVEAGFSAIEIPRLKLFGPGAQQCAHCENGYKGRIALFEVMPISEKMAERIMSGDNAQHLAQQAQKEHITNLRQSGLEKVRTGLTSLSEILCAS